MGSLRRATRSLHDHRVAALAVVVGISTGLLVAVFERVVRAGVIDHLLEAPLGVQVVAPLVGFGLAGLILRHLVRGASPSLADDYLRAFHDRETRLPLRELPLKLAAGAATVLVVSPRPTTLPSSSTASIWMSRSPLRPGAAMLNVTGNAALSRSSSSVRDVPPFVSVTLRLVASWTAARLVTVTMVYDCSSAHAPSPAHRAPAKEANARRRLTW